MIILDFYNYLYQKNPEINQHIIERHLSLISLYAREFNTTIIVVFDGIRYKEFIQKNYYGLNIIYALPDADSYIIKQLRQSPARTYTILSLDNDIKSEAKKKQAKILDMKEFIFQLHILGQPIQTYKKHSPHITKITEELDDELDNLMKKSHIQHDKE
jgi:hypothetical protein